MTLDEFARAVPGLAGMGHVDKILHLGWHLLAHGGLQRFAAPDIRGYYEQLHYAQPAKLATQLQQMADAKTPKLLRDKGGYRLEARTKEQLDAKYSTRPETVAVAAALEGLPGRVSDEAERLFLTEALSCFRVRAYRAAVVMTWNLTYDHLLNWVMANHLAAFNAAIVRKYHRRAGVAMTKKEDFADEFTEFEVLEVCGTAGVIDGNTKKILNEKLVRRNMAAHPSLVQIGQHQAEDVITDLVNNVILRLT